MEKGVTLSILLKLIQPYVLHLKMWGNNHATLTVFG